MQGAIRDKYYFASKGSTIVKGLLADVHNYFHHPRNTGELANIIHCLDAIRLDLKCFRYAGTRLNSPTSSWCNEMCGKIFTLNEARMWPHRSEDYMPLVDMGVNCTGSNECRHYPAFMTNELAISYRPNIEFFDESELGEWTMLDIDLMLQRAHSHFLNVGKITSGHKLCR